MMEEVGLEHLLVDIGRRERDLASSSRLKRSFDIVLALVLIVLFSPLMLLCALLVRFSGQEVIFGHTRVGKSGKLFKCFKFRTMVPLADEVLDQLLAKHPEMRDEWSEHFKLKDDPRMTGIGKFLRKTSLDELPQLWNVLKGDMSLVGPRPIIIDELFKYGDDARYYISVLPGITGPWQVSGRNDLTYCERVSLDVDYVKRHGFLRDVVILFKTIGAVFSQRGAS